MKSDLPTSPLWLHNGELQEADHGVLSAAEIGRLNGTGLFETIPLYEGIPFALADHWERLTTGASRFGLPCPSLESLASSLSLLAEHNDARQWPLARARVTLLPTSGSSGTVHEVIEVGAPPSHPETARVILLPYRRNEKGALTGIKSINYGENTVALREAREHGADEAIFANTQDLLCEGIWTNIFVKIDGGWTTPFLSSGCLPGVTRKHVLELADEIVESEIPMNLSDEIESAFLTSSMREIQPIAKIDGRELSSPEDPDISRWQQDYRETVSRSFSSP